MMKMVSQLKKPSADSGFNDRHGDIKNEYLLLSKDFPVFKMFLTQTYLSTLAVYLTYSKANDMLNVGAAAVYIFGWRDEQSWSLEVSTAVKQTYWRWNRRFCEIRRLK